MIIDPKRLSEEPESALEAELLNTGRRAAPAGAKQRALLAASSVGIAEGLASFGAAAQGTSAAPALGKAGLLTALKWVGILTVTGATAVVAAGALDRHLHDLAPSRAKAPAAAAGAAHDPVAGPQKPLPPSNRAAPVVPPPIAAFVGPSPSGARTSGTGVGRAAPRAPDDSRPPSPDSRPAPDSRPTAPDSRIPSPDSRNPAPDSRIPSPDSRNPAPDDSRTSNATSLSTELALLGRAQEALNAGEIHRALALLDSYAERFPAGDMREEAIVLRIEAFARSGDHAQASRLADAFLARAPDSPYASRVRSLLRAHTDP